MYYFSFSHDFMLDQQVIITIIIPDHTYITYSISIFGKLFFVIQMEISFKCFDESAF